GTTPSENGGYCPRHHRDSESEPSYPISCAPSRLQSKRNHDPLTLGQQRPLNERMVSQAMSDARDVVLDVPPVVMEIRIPAAKGRCEQNVELPVKRNPARARADGMRHDSVDHERALEILHEQVTEVVDLALSRAPIGEESLGSVPSNRHRGAERHRPEKEERQVPRLFVGRRPVRRC